MLKYWNRSSVYQLWGKVVLLGLVFACSGQIGKSAEQAAEAKEDRVAKAARYAELGFDGGAEVLDQLAAKGDPRAGMWVALLKYRGGGRNGLKYVFREINATNVFPGVLKLAEKGDVEARFLAGYGYMYGLGGEKDLEKGAQYFISVADTGHGSGLYYSALAFAHGFGVTPDIEKARTLMKRAKDNGVDRAVGYLREIENTERDDRDRMEKLFRNTLVSTIGMSIDDAVDSLVMKKLILFPKQRISKLQGPKTAHTFLRDGMVLKESLNGRVSEVLAMTGGMQFAQRNFSGKGPSGLVWGDAEKVVRNKLGDPDLVYSFDSGIQGRLTTWLYNWEQFTLRVQFSKYRDGKLVIWQVISRWQIEGTPEGNKLRKSLDK